MRQLKLGVLYQVAVLVLGASLGACSRTDPQVALSPTPPPTPTPEPTFSGERALEHVQAQVDFGPRSTGSVAWRETGDYILETLAAAGWRTEEQPFEYQGVNARNLIAKSGGDYDQVIVLGAHYDTRRLADQDQANPTQAVLGANDGASGTAVLLELARVLNTLKIQAQVWLVFFDAEDNGRLDDWDWIIGSRYFVSALEVRPRYAIVVDMVGDADLDLYYEANSDPYLREELWDVAAWLGYDEVFVPEVRHSMLDDHTPFLEAAIPAVDIIDFDYPYWHTTSDTVDKVSASSLERVGRVLETFLEAGGTYERPTE